MEKSNQVVDEAHERAWLWLTLQKSKYSSEKKKVQRKSQVNRYLTWLKEDAKKYNSGLIYMPLMFRQSSIQGQTLAVWGSQLLAQATFVN